VIISGPARRSGRILLVDADTDAALFTAHVLTTRGQFAVTATADPVAALRLIICGACDLVLTEAELPWLSGRRLVAAVRHLVPQLPVVVLTARLLCGAEADTLRELSDAYLEKPVPADRLVATVARALASPAL
jgi:CheY-like chemotaxis protein